MSSSHAEPPTTDFPPATARCSSGRASRSRLASYFPPVASTAAKQVWEVKIQHISSHSHLSLKNRWWKSCRNINNSCMMGLCTLASVADGEGCPWMKLVSALSKYEWRQFREVLTMFCPLGALLQIHRESKHRCELQQLVQSPPFSEQAILPRGPAGTWKCRRAFWKTLRHRCLLPGD